MQFGILRQPWLISFASRPRLSQNKERIRLEHWFTVCACGGNHLKYNKNSSLGPSLPLASASHCLTSVFSAGVRTSREGLLCVPVQGVGGVRRIAEFVQQRGARLQDDHVVNDHGHQHHHHLQLVVDPQEHRAGHQAEDAAVDQVLEGSGKRWESTAG